MAALGPRTAGCRDAPATGQKGGEETFVGTRPDDEDAPIPGLRVAMIERRICGASSFARKTEWKITPALGVISVDAPRIAECSSWPRVQITV